MGRVRAHSRAQILRAGLFEGGPDTGHDGAWLQDTELINDDTRKKDSFRCGPAMSVAKQTTTKLEKPNYNMYRDYESYY